MNKILGNFRLNGTKDENGDQKDYSNYDNPVVLTGTEAYEENQTGSQVLRFDDGDGRVQHLVEGSPDILRANDLLNQISPPTYGEVNVLAINQTTLDGEVDLGVIPNFINWTGMKLSAMFKVPSTGHDSGGRFISISYSGGGDIRFLPGLNMTVAMDDGTVTNMTVPDATNDTWILLEFEHDGSTMRARMDGTGLWTEQAETFDYANAIGNLRLGNFGNSSAKGSIAWIKVSDYNGYDEIYHTFAEGEGAPSESTITGDITWDKATIPELSNHRAGHTPAVVSDATGKYIDTGVVPTETMSIKTTYTVGDTSVNQVIFGVRDSISANRFNVFQIAGGQLRMDWGSEQSNSTHIVTVGETVTLEFRGSSAYINGEFFYTFPDYTFTGFRTIKLFALDNAGVMGNFLDGSILSCEIKDNGSVTRSMVPLEGGKFLDRVNNVVYSNSGAGTLTTRYNTAISERVYDQSALQFDGVGDYVISQNNIVVGDSFTIEMDLSVPSTIGSGFNSIFANRNDATSEGAIALERFSGGTGNLLHLRPVGAPSRESFNVGALTTGKDILRIEYASGVLKTWLNGVLTQDTSMDHYNGFTNSDPFAIMARPSGNNNVEGGVYKFEVEGHMAYDFTNIGEFDNPSSVVDQSGNGNDGAITSTSGLDIMWKKLYKVQALPTQSELTFDGVGDFVSINGRAIFPELPIEGHAGTWSVVCKGLPNLNYPLGPIAQGLWSSWNPSDFFRMFNIQIRDDAIRLNISSTNSQLRFGPIVWDETKFYTITVVAPTDATLADVRVFLDGAELPLITTFFANDDGDLNSLFYLAGSGFTIAQRVDGNDVWPGTIRSVKVFDYENPTAEGVGNALDYDFTTYTGKTAEVLTDLSGNGNDGTITSTDGDVSSMWSRWSNRVVGANSAVVSYGAGQYIDLGIPCSPDLRYKVTLSDWVVDSGRTGGASGSNDRFYIEVTSTTEIRAVIGGITDLLLLTDLSGVVTIELFPNGDVYLNGEFAGNTGGSVDLVDVDTMYLMASESGGSDINHLGATWYGCELRVAGELVRDLVPQLDGKFLDLVENKVYSNDGTGTLVTTNLISDGEGNVVDSNNYLPIAHEGNKVFNNCEVTLTQTDASLNTHPFWSDGAGTLEAKYYEDMILGDTDKVYGRVDGFNDIVSLVTEDAISVTLNGFTDLNFDPNNFTIVAKINTTDNYTDINRPIFEKENGNDYVIKISLVGDDDKFISITGRESSSTYGLLKGSKVVNDGIDHVIVCTFDGTYWKSYVDGQLIDTVEDAVSITNVDLGCNIGVDFDGNYDGTIGDIQVYNGALSLAEVKNITTAINNAPKVVDPRIPLLGNISKQTNPIGIRYDTGIEMSDDVSIECLYQPFKELDDLQDGRRMFGTVEGADRWELYYSSVSVYKFFTDLGGSQLIPYDGKLALIKWDASTGDYSVNGVTHNRTKSASVETANIFIFGSTGTNFTPAPIGGFNYFKIWKSGTLVAHFVPQGDNFYDLVTGTVITNIGEQAPYITSIPYKEESGLVFSTRDGITDLTGKNTLTNTDTVVGNGMVFNGTTSKLDIGDNTTIPNSAVTFKYIFNQNSFGEGTDGNIITDGKLIIFHSGESSRLTFTNDSVTFLSTDALSISNDMNIHIVVVRNYDETVDIYMNAILVKSGNCGAIITGTTNTIIGNNSTSTRTFDGKIENVEIYSEAKSADWVKQDYENEVRFW